MVHPRGCRTAGFATRERKAAGGGGSFDSLRCGFYHPPPLRPSGSFAAPHLFSEVGRLGSEHSLQELSEFSMRPEAEKSPRAMGLEPYHENGHTRFRPKRVKEKKAHQE